MEYEYPELNERKWKTPDSYFGFDPVDDVCICGQSRDSDVLERSNYETIMRHLQDAEERLAEENPEEYEAAYAKNDHDLFIYDFRASHWAVGWVEQLLMSKHAPDSLQMAVVSVINALADYPIFDEEHCSELEWNETNEYWASLGLDERIELVKEYGSGNIFSARHDYLTDSADPSGSLFDYLRTP